MLKLDAETPLLYLRCFQHCNGSVYHIDTYCTLVERSDQVKSEESHMFSLRCANRVRCPFIDRSQHEA